MRFEGHVGETLLGHENWAWRLFPHQAEGFLLGVGDDMALRCWDLA